MEVRDDGSLCARFAQPQRAVTPGQSLVLSDGDHCLGGAVIAATDAPLERPRPDTPPRSRPASCTNASPPSPARCRHSSMSGASPTPAQPSLRRFLPASTAYSTTPPLPRALSFSPPPPPVPTPP